MKCRLLLLVVLLLSTAGFAGPLDDAAKSWDRWNDAIDVAVVDSYAAPEKPLELPPVPQAIQQWQSADAKALLAAIKPESTATATAAVLRARSQQALVLEINDAVQKGDVERARVWRARLGKPRGVSSTEGALLLQNLPAGPNQRKDAAKVLVREAITWQTTRARQLLDEASRSTSRTTPMKHRLIERVVEAMTLADLPDPLRQAAGLGAKSPESAGAETTFAAVAAADWNDILGPTRALQRVVESALPSLLTDKEKARRERLLLKLIVLVPREYAAGVRDGEITVPLEYREAVTFTAQARQMVGELAPLWLAATDHDHRPAVEKLEESLAAADAAIARKAPGREIDDAFSAAREAMEKGLGVSIKRSGSTSEIVDEIMVDVRSLLNQSLAAGLQGRWADAESLRLEAYTTYDPDLEARLMPRDPQLAIDIEILLLDGIDKPGVKALLDKRVGGAELEAAYVRVNEALARAAAILKTGVDPTAAGINAASIVLREGLEGLLVIIAILAGLRGVENRNRRLLVWLGVVLSGIATAATYLLSITIISSLSSYAEVIEAVTALLAIVILLLITNWLFHQIYWNQWVTSLKSQSQGESAWQLISVGFLIGYREGFETVVFLQSLVMDVGGTPVGVGVAIGMLILFVLGFAALKLGLKLPYFKLLMLTALLIGVVLITFVGNGVRAMQTVGWLPVHRILPVSWPAWMGQWAGLYNTWETIIAQVLMCCVVLGTWRVSRWKAKREAAERRAARSGQIEAPAWRTQKSPDLHPKPA